MAKQIKSRKRVEEFGEVFTNEREVKAMLDLDGIKEKSYNIEATFLEPACGEGVFLVEILKRKLETINKEIPVMHKKIHNKIPYEIKIITAVGSIYGIDIQEDNVETTIDNLYKCIESEYKNKVKGKYSKNFLESVRYILKTNIILGNGLTYKQNDGNDIYFSKWIINENNTVTKEDYKMKDMIELPEEEQKPIKYTRKKHREVYKIERRVH